MAKHYQEIVDEVFGSYYRHRTLRTLFDPNSNEWTETTINEKLEILKTLLDSNKIDLDETLIGYKHFYQKELANKSHVLNSLQDGLAILLSNSLK
jgi:hypothetical protein